MRKQLGLERLTLPHQEPQQKERNMPLMLSKALTLALRLVQLTPPKIFLRGTLGLLPPAVGEEAAEEVVVELPLERYRVRVHLVLL